jgi:hypothetical protein
MNTVKKVKNWFLGVAAVAALSLGIVMPACAEDVAITPASLGIDLAGTATGFFTAWGVIASGVFGCVLGLYMLYKLMTFLRGNKAGV